MEFRDERKHSLERLAQINSFDFTKRISPLMTLRTADQMVAHGHPNAQPLLHALRNVRHHEVALHVARLQLSHKEVAKGFRLNAVDDQLLNSTYRENGYFIVKNQRPVRKLLVLFSTMFNNFFFSNLVFCHLLRDLDCHILYLKDSTLANFHHGVEGLAPDIPGIAERIKTFASEIGADQLYFSGFSSGGYPALLISLLVGGAGFVGFSHETDLSPGAKYPPGSHFTPEVRARVNPRWLLDLRAELVMADPATPRWMYYGANDHRDAGHARNLEGVAGIEVNRVADVGHNTVLCLMASGQLLPIFNRLIADR